MQLIAVGLHRHNVPPEIWKRGAPWARDFYRRLHAFSEKEPQGEVLFIRTPSVREIVGAVENVPAALKYFKQLLRRQLRIEDDRDLAYHEVVGPDAARHFLYLALGLEGQVAGEKPEFLHATEESIERANETGMAGPILNRLFQIAILLNGRFKQKQLRLNIEQLFGQIRALIQKIFGDPSRVKILVIGENEFSAEMLARLNAESFPEVYLFVERERGSAEAELDRIQRISPELLDYTLLRSDVVIRLNQSVRSSFTPENINRLMKLRKNEPLLMIHLDPTMKANHELAKIYNLFIYELADFGSSYAKTESGERITEAIEDALKDFFSWFYSKERFRFGNIIGKSAAIERILELIARISQTDITVLIQGESGTGKELIARAIHEHSLRREKPFIAVNCGALTETLLESELFGHEKGAFTGATYTKKGLFEEAHTGTIFLDEIGDTSPALQVKLLRVLQEGEIKRVGSSETIQIDVRLIAATNRDLMELVEQGKFRKDLYYRLNVVNIEIPPLRERVEDILPLAEYFVRKYSERMGKRITGFSERARKALLEYSWPGNVRELENAIERAVALAIGNVIHSTDLPDFIRLGSVEEIARVAVRKSLSLKEVERQVIWASLVANNWNYDLVAETLGIGRTTLWRKMKEYGISRESA